MTTDTIDYPTQKNIEIVNEPIIGVSSIGLPLIEMTGTITVTAGRLRDAIMTDSVDKQLHEYISDKPNDFFEFIIQAFPDGLKAIEKVMDVPQYAKVIFDILTKLFGLS